MVVTARNFQKYNIDIGAYVTQLHLPLLFSLGIVSYCIQVLWTDQANQLPVIQTKPFGSQIGSIMIHSQLNRPVRRGGAGVRLHPTSWANYFKIHFSIRNWVYTPNFGLKIGINLGFAPRPRLKSLHMVLFRVSFIISLRTTTVILGRQANCAVVYRLGRKYKQLTWYYRCACGLYLRILQLLCKELYVL